MPQICINCLGTIVQNVSVALLLEAFTCESSWLRNILRNPHFSVTSFPSIFSTVDCSLLIRGPCPCWCRLAGGSPGLPAVAPFVYRLR